MDADTRSMEPESPAGPRPAWRGPAWLRLLVPSTPWLAGLAVFAAVCLAPNAGRPISFDTFLHVYMGEHMLERGELVDVDPSNWALDKPYLDHEWAPQLLFGAFHQAFGLEGLVLLTGLLAALAYGLVAAWMRRKGAGPGVTAALLLAAFEALRLFTLARPFLLTWILALVWAMLLESLIRRDLTPGRWLAVAVPLMWLWANLHAGFFLGFFLLGLFGLAQLWRITAAERGARPAEVRLFLWMLGGGQLALFASALNPYGFRLHAHFLVYLANTRLTSQIIEWQAPYFHSSDFTAALLLLGFSLLVWLISPRRLEPAELLLVLALLLAALRSQRNLPLFVLLTLPVTAACLEALLARLATADSWLRRPAGWILALSRWAGRAETRRGGVLTAALLVPVAVAALGVFKLHPVELDERKFPIAAARFVEERPELFGGRMLNFYSWGGYLAWRLWPDHQVFINGLQDHHGAAHHGAYTTVIQARPEWRRILDEAGVDWLILPAKIALASVLDADAGWRRVYGDSMAAIFVRAEPAGPPSPPRVASWAMRRLDELVNVLVVVLDTTRADAVSAYGEAGAHTPALDRLAGDGALFSRARSTSAWTLPSHGSLFTGLYPSRHGAHWEHQLLAWQQTTMAELLAPTHRTAAFSENPHITQAKGFAQGFESFDETWRHPRAPGDLTLDRVDAWLEGRDPARPFFLFVNLMTPHLPYRPPDELLERFLPAGVAAEEVAELRAFSEREARRFITGDLELDPRRLTILRALYRADVAWADRRVGRLVRRLEDAGELDDTLIVVVGDHGENLGDHRLMEHQLCLYETLLRVPMILRLPGAVAARVDPAPAQLVDLLPTVLEAVGVPRDRWPATQGQSLLLAGPPPERPIFAEYMRPSPQRRLFAEVDPDFDFDPHDRRLKSIQVGDAKLILVEGGPAELYDLAGDPGETRNLAAANPRLAAALRARLEAWAEGFRPAAGAPPEPALDEATTKALRSLGYLD